MDTSMSNNEGLPTKPDEQLVPEDVLIILPVRNTVVFPGEDTPRPFTDDDILYIIGASRYGQRYLYEVDRNVYAVLPAEWDVAEGVWRPYLLEETWPAPAYDGRRTAPDATRPA